MQFSRYAEPLALKRSERRVDCVIPICSIILSILSLSRQCCMGTSATRSMGCFSPACTDTVCRSWARSSRLRCLCCRDSSSFWKTNCLPASPPTPATKPSQVLNHHRGATVISTGFELKQSVLWHEITPFLFVAGSGRATCTLSHPLSVKQLQF